MAKIGMEYIVIGELDESATSAATAKYTKGRYLGPASTFNGSPTANDVKDYGDDRTVETDTSVTGGTLSIELNERTAEVYCQVLGHTLSEDGEVLANTEDIAPFLGVGAVGKSRRSGKTTYTGKFYYKTQFREPSDENATKQESTSFTHTTLEGSLFQMESGDWKSEKEFETLTEAKEWLDKKIGITSE